jgi:hypothetical protein
LRFYGRQQQKKNQRVFLHIFFQEILFEDFLACLGVRSSFPPPVRPSDCGFSAATGSFGASAEVALDEDISGTVDGLPKASAGLATEFWATAGTIFGGIGTGPFDLAGKILLEVAGLFCGEDDP